MRLKTMINITDDKIKELLEKYYSKINPRHNIKQCEINAYRIALNYKK